MKTDEVKTMNVNEINYIRYKDSWIDPNDPIKNLNDTYYLLGGIKIRFHNRKKTRRIVYRELKNIFRFMVIISVIYILWRYLTW